MKTNGVVGSAALALCLWTLPLFAQAELSLPDSVDRGSAVSSGETYTGLIGGPSLIPSEPESCDCFGCRDPHWFGGVEMTFLKINANQRGVISLSFDDSDTAGTDFQAQPVSGLDSFAYAPRMWIGRQFGDHWGTAVRFWSVNDFDLGPTEAVNPPLPNFATILTQSQAALYSIDLDLIRSFGDGDVWKIDTMFGARYASYSSRAEVFAFGVFTTGNFVNLTLQNHSSFAGTGPTMAIQGRRRIGDSPCFFVIGARGSHLWGERTDQARAAGTVASSPSAPLVGAATVTRAGDSTFMNVVEGQMGFQWEYELFDSQVNAFVRAMAEYQLWTVGGGNTGGAGFGGTIGDLTTNSFAATGAGAVNLYGVSFAAGFTW